MSKTALTDVYKRQHPCHALGTQPFKQGAAGVKEGVGAAIFARGVLLGGYDAAAQVLRHELAAVANTQHRHAQLKDGGV